MANAFRLAPDKKAALQRDALPTSLGRASLLVKIFFWASVVIVVLMLFRCGSGGGSRNCDDALATFGAASAEYQNCLNANRGGGGSAPAAARSAGFRAAAGTSSGRRVSQRV